MKSKSKSKGRMSLKRSTAAIKSPFGMHVPNKNSKLKSAIEAYLKYIKKTDEACGVKRSVNPRLEELMQGGNIDDPEKLSRIKKAIDNTLGNEIPRQKLVEFCGENSDKMLEKVGNLISSSRFFGRKRRQRKSKSRRRSRRSRSRRSRK